MKKNQKIVYVVINEGEIVFASYDEEKANQFANEKKEDAINEVLNEWEIDDLTHEDMAEVNFQSGYDNGVWEISSIDISDIREDEEIEIDGDIFEFNDLLEKLKESKYYNCN